jgi:signal transduction histidine kinase
VLASLKAFRTSSFRLVAIYLTLFAISAGAILAYVYYSTVGLLEAQTEETIRAEVQALNDQYRVRGMPGILDIVVRRSIEGNGSLYSLKGPDGSHIAGNLEVLPKVHIKDGEWIDFPITVGKGESATAHTAHAYHVELRGEDEVLVGRDVQELRQFGDLIRRTLYWALGMAGILGLGGGYMLSRNFLRRVDAITETSHTIMAGDLSRRMPVSGSGDELDRLSASLNEMLSQIERLMLGMKEVSSNVAHDLKTPLTRMRARVESALRNNNKSDYKGALNQTIEECDGLLRTFNSLLSIAQAEAGQSREGLQVLDAHQTLSDVFELYEPMVEEAKGTLTIDSNQGLPVRADRQLLAQALTNLIDNALKYGEGADGKGPDINVSGKIEGANVVVSVVDHGKGIPKADRERVRDRFVRLDESRSKPGNGLGLSMVSSVMTLHGGQLQLEDNNPGLKAVLRFPLHLT